MAMQVLRSTMANFWSWSLRVLPVQASLSIFAFMASSLTARFQSNLLTWSFWTRLRYFDQVKRLDGKLLNLALVY